MKERNYLFALMDSGGTWNLSH